MELYTQIKKNRTDLNLSQEELAEKVYVTRQTISNWENNKSYPDIHSLLLLSSTFNISLDQLIKGDVNIMREEINKREINQLNRDGAKFTGFLILFVVSVVPLSVFLGIYGLLIAGVIWGVSMIYASKIEKLKKINDIQTYKEILSFTEGKRLDEIEKAKESGKRPYQKFLLVLLVGFIAFIVCMFFVWLLRSYIF
ncbi:helix-turn-helix transcriptional regulator [Clostridium boliviensis]|uniref:Helix-turn-helix transcriptional regulator n=1 Tax=Clostridium boliviensis TaxID=318465 RepID=A0ABU4GEX7_9CLOT|nr:helix-turn-helix transcriptional regulator [Clostridium boliviensis]MDW2796161.1 helix-turn-helix transcriptional regulator [Clostridium boliviensis]